MQSRLHLQVLVIQAVKGKLRVPIDEHLTEESYNGTITKHLAMD